MEFVAGFFIFVVLVALTALLFGGWVIYSLIRLVFRGIAAVIKPMPLPPMPRVNSGAVRGVRCTNVKCRHVNPGIAQFCRHCGNALPSATRVPVRRVAMW